MEPNGYRKRRKDYVHQQNGDLSTSSIDDELDPWTAWAYRPHTITLLLIGACFLIWASGALDPENSSSGDLVTSVKRGIWAMIAVFLAYCLLQAPSTLLIRPHPAFWRLVHGMAVVYLVALTFLLFQNRDDARQFMKYLHPDLGVELPERSYGADCRIYMPENPTSRICHFEWSHSHCSYWNFGSNTSSPAADVSTFCGKPSPLTPPPFLSFRIHTNPSAAAFIVDSH